MTKNNKIMEIGGKKYELVPTSIKDEDGAIHNLFGIRPLEVKQSWEIELRGKDSFATVIEINLHDIPGKEAEAIRKCVEALMHAIFKYGPELDRWERFIEAYDHARKLIDKEE